MKSLHLFFLILFIFTFCCFSCEKTPTQLETPEVPADTTEVPIDTTEIIPEIYPKEITFTEYSLEGTSCDWSMIHWTSDVSPYVGKLIVINNDEELKNYITGDDYLAIDFSKYTLLLSYSYAPQLIMDIISKRVQQVSENSYTLNIYIILTMARMPEKWTCAFLIPKIADEATVTLDVRQETFGPILWQAKSLRISGELVNIVSPPEDSILYQNMTLQFLDQLNTKQNTEIGYTFRNVFVVDCDIQDNQKVSFKDYRPILSHYKFYAEDHWGIAFKENLLNTVKYEISENSELIFFDSDNNPIIVFIRWT